MKKNVLRFAAIDDNNKMREKADPGTKILSYCGEKNTNTCGKKA